MADTSQLTRPTSREALVGSFHSIGPDGPTYQVLRILDDKRALICILDAEREVDYSIADILEDPGPDAWRSQ
jgi:hypothetical protein